MHYIFDTDDVYKIAESIGAETTQKGNELFFKYCPYCDGGNSRKDKDTMSINLDTGAFKCFRSSCNKQGYILELARDFNVELGSQEPQQFRTLPQRKVTPTESTFTYLQKRCISKKTAERYNITTRTDNSNILVFPFYDENNILQFVKYRNTKFKKGIDKNKEWSEKNTKPILFGMNQCVDFETLVITEGQIDALSLAECEVKNAVSVPTGASGFKWLSYCAEWVEKFKEVIVFGDYEKGHITLIDELNKRLQMPVKCVRKIDYLCEKDANDILCKYGKEAIIKAVKNAELLTAESVKRLADVVSVDITTLPKIETNIDELDRAIGGIYYGQVVLLSGKRGEGKSTFMSQLVANAIEQGVSVFVYSGELPNAHFKYWLDLQIAGCKHLKEKTNKYGEQEYYISPEIANIINHWYYDKAFIYDNSAIDDIDGELEKEHKGILDIIKDSICKNDVKLICIDNLMTALDCDINTDIYRKQSDFVKKLARLAKKYNVAVILIAHPKKTNGQNSFNNDDVSGSADITNAVDVVMNYERNKSEDANYAGTLAITKNRLTGVLLTGEHRVKLSYSHKSKRIQSAFKSESQEYSCFTVQQEEMSDCLPF